MPIVSKQEAPKPVEGRKLGFNSTGEFEIYQSDVELLRSQYQLLAPEAEQVLVRCFAGKENVDKVVDELINSRRVFKPVYEAVPVTEA